MDMTFQSATPSVKYAALPSFKSQLTPNGATRSSPLKPSGSFARTVILSQRDTSSAKYAVNLPLIFIPDLSHRPSHPDQSGSSLWLVDSSVQWSSEWWSFSYSQVRAQVLPHDP
jgi:hypothetical protein